MRALLEQFQQKCAAVLRPELRKNKELERFREDGNAREQFQQKCAAVLRPELRKNKKLEQFRDSKKIGMALVGATGMLLLAGQVTAEPRYDRVLEQAAVDIVAANIGTLRGGFAYNQVPEMIVVQEAPPPRRPLADGLVPAVERPPASLLF